MGIAVYLPSLALTSVTPITLEWSIVITTVICTFYTTLGGIKAVIWTDVLQALLMLVGMLSVFLRVVSLIGFDVIVEAVKRGERNNFFKIATDPRERNSMFTYIFGFMFLIVGTTCSSQVLSQRYLSCKSAWDARKALLWNSVPSDLFMFLAVANGMAMYAYYEGCDTFTAGKIERQDQALPYMVVEIFEGVPGVAGLYVAAAYSGTLSTVSSGINSIATVVVNDYIAVLRPTISLRAKFTLSKIFSGITGAVVLCMALIVSTARGTILNLSFALDGCMSGSMLGVFLLAGFFPFVSSKGATIGLTCGILTPLWISIGNMVYGANPEFSHTLPVSIEACNMTSSPENLSTMTTSTIMTETKITNERPWIADTLYSVSPYYITTIGLITTLFVGVVASLITGRKKTCEADPNTFIPLVDHKIFSPKIRKFFRFGVPELKEYKREDSFKPLYIDNNQL